MKCKRIRRYLPFYIESDLSPKNKEAVRVHLNTCNECQKAYEAYVRSLKTAKEWLDESAVVWKEAEWKRIVQNAVAEKSKSLSGFEPWPFKRGWAIAAMAAVMIIFIFFVTRPLFLDLEDFPGQNVLAKGNQQDVVSMTMVSKDTGLKVVWILNKNFNLEENP